jgi:hypothetical protein
VRPNRELGNTIFHPEDRARMTIDGQLAQAGWLVQSREEMNRSAGLGVAVREFPTTSGQIDYALFLSGTLCGVIEAKPEGTTLSGFSDQAARYLGGVPEHLVGAKVSSASNTSPRVPRSCSAIMLTRRRVRAACSFFTARRLCGAGLPSR